MQKPGDFWPRFARFLSGTLAEPFGHRVEKGDFRSAIKIFQLMAETARRTDHPVLSYLISELGLSFYHELWTLGHRSEAGQILRNEVLADATRAGPPDRLRPDTPGHKSLPSGWIDRKARHSPCNQTQKSTVVREPAVPKQSGQHRQGLVGKRLVYERLLSLKRLDRATRGQTVACVQFRIDDLRKQVSHSRQSGPLAFGVLVLRFPEDKLAAVRVVADVQPIAAILVCWRAHNKGTRFAGVNTAYQHICFVIPSLI